MATIINCSIDLSKIDKTKIVTGKNGSQYYNITVNVNDTTDQFGNNVQVTNPQTKEQREAKEQRVFLGNGKVNWTNGTTVVAEKKQAVNSNDSQDLPF
jgi:hypothetical protein